MDRLPTVQLFVEDLAHERFVTALVERIAEEEGVDVVVKVGNATGGHGKAITELQTFQKSLASIGGTPDLLVACIDGNCTGWSQSRDDVTACIDTSSVPRSVALVPDPHVERWFMADPDALQDAMGLSVNVPAEKCERNYYKELWLNALRAAGEIVVLGGAEFADKVVQTMDLYRAGKNVSSLGHAIDDLRAELKRLGGRDWGFAAR